MVGDRPVPTVRGPLFSDRDGQRLRRLGEFLGAALIG